MKIIVSDYDDTINRHFYINNLFKIADFKLDIRSINNFIEEGNKFIISTKRNYPSIKYELDRNHIKFSYVTSYDGLVTFDDKENLIYANYMSKDIIDYIKEQINSSYYKGSSIVYYNEEGIVSSDNSNIILIVVKYNDFNKIFNLLKSINLRFKNISMSYEYGYGKIYIHNTSDKKIGLDRLIENIDELRKLKDIIVTLGDSFDDLPMLNSYNGYTVKNSELASNFDSSKIVPNVRTLIKKIK